MEYSYTLFHAKKRNVDSLICSGAQDQDPVVLGHVDMTQDHMTLTLHSTPIVPTGVLRALAEQAATQ